MKDSLKACPLCLTAMSDELRKRMGVRHYQKLNEGLPSKVRAMDLDFVLEQAATDRLLVIEFKPSKARLSYGQSETLHWFKRKGADVWIVMDGRFQDEGTVDVSRMEKDGKFRHWYGPMSERGLADVISDWWSFGLCKAVT